MGLLLTLRGISKAYGIRPLFTDLSLSFNEGERIGLIGPNGSGKSTLLKIMAGIETADAGERIPRGGARLAYLAQKDVFTEPASVEAVMLEEAKRLALPADSGRVEAAALLSKLGFDDPDEPVAALSGGRRKRLALARALLGSPDALLLDEPTNHLDLETILWLENWLSTSPVGFILVSHDRAFLERTTRETIELSKAYPGGFFRVDGPYSFFLEKRDAFLAGQAGAERILANQMRREIEWLRRGPKARTTKAKARIDAADSLKSELAAVRDRNRERSSVQLDFSGTGRDTKRLLVAEGIGKSFGDKALFWDVDIVLTPGTRLGLAGGNGSGKTTLLSTLAGILKPDSGTVRTAPAVQTLYFDQKRESLDPALTIKQTLAPDGDSVLFQGRLVHQASYVQRFAFRVEQLDQPVGLLSGGEQARLLIARLMLSQADVLFLDEPTNDLDIDTLERLEGSLVEFPGAVVLISHDRLLLDRVSTVILGLDGEGGTTSFADYDQWEADFSARRRERTAKIKDARPKASLPKDAPKPKANGKKLTWKEERELEGIEAAIEAAESTCAACEAAMSDPSVASVASELAARCSAYEAAKAEVDRLYERYAELEEKRQSI